MYFCNNFCNIFNDFRNLTLKIIENINIYNNILACYLDYEIPSMETLDSNDMETLYHVTQRHTVESICKFGFDREFNCKNGNA